MSTKTFQYSTCRQCPMQFQPVTWIPYRAAGFCSEKCCDLFAEWLSPDGALGRGEEDIGQGDLFGETVEELSR